MRPWALYAFCFVQARVRGKKKKIALALALAASSDSSSTRSEQKRFTGCVMTKECPCSPREATLGASPRRRAAAGRANLSIIPRRTASRARRRYVREPPKKNCRCSFRGSSASRTSRPRRGTSRTCGPLSKRAPIAGVLRPLSQVTFCERAANETHIICVSAFPRSSSFAAGFGLKKKKNKRFRRENRQKPTSRAPRLSHPVLVTVFFSRKMVNILNVDRHRQSVAWIKLCIIENVVRVFRAFGSGGRRAMGTSRAAVIALHRASRAFGRIRLCIRRWATPDNRRFRPSLSARKVQPSESRSAGIKRPRICTHSCLGGNDEKKNLERRNRRRSRRAPRSAKPSDGMLNWRHGRTRGLPDNYSGPISE